jgi:hypothetical protein
MGVICRHCKEVLIEDFCDSCGVLRSHGYEYEENRGYLKDVYGHVCEGEN